MRRHMIWLAVGAVAACGEEEPAGPITIEDAMQQASVPGLAVARLDNCSLVSTEYYGVADVETQAKVGRTTAFEAASLSKPVLGYITMQLVDEGVISLDDKVAETIDFPRATDQEAYAKVTPRILLSHSSGMPNWAGNSRDPDRTNPIRFYSEPGTDFRYSGEGYVLLQQFVEAKTGKGLEELRQERLGAAMPMATYGDPLPDGLTPAFGHDIDGTKEEGREISVPVVANAASSLRTNLESYAGFAERLCDGEGLSEEAFETMTTPQTPTEDEGVIWGLGIGLQLDEGRKTLFHWGDNGEFKAFVAVVPETGDGIVYFANGDAGLQLIDRIASPEVGNLQPTIEWLDYD